MISSIRRDDSRARMPIERPPNALIFPAYVRDVLVPTLRAKVVTILDNRSTRQSETTLAVLEQAAAREVFLPPYSPDLNPSSV